MRLYLDASAIIYSIEGVSGFRKSALTWIESVEGADEGLMLTSRLSRLECLVKPLKTGRTELLALYEGFFVRDKLRLIEVSADVIERACDLRARYGFRAPDAIHLATAILFEADTFLSGNAALERCSELKVVTLKP